VRIIFLYRLIQLFAFPFLFVYFAWRLISNRQYRAHFRERLGFIPRRFHRTAPGAIWLHAVSAGEVITAQTLIEALRAQEPRIAIFLSTSTTAGRAVAFKKLENIVDGIFYCPLDYASCVRRTLDAIKPSLVLIFETEIWPNLYAEIKRVGANLAIVNARISSRTWSQYLSMKWFFAPVLRLPDLVFPQSVMDRDRYYRLGVPLSRLHQEGNLKYDASVTPTSSSLPTFGAHPIWIAASTVAPGESRHYKHNVDEDAIVLDAFDKLRRKFPRLLLILAPRQPKRFEPVARMLRERKLSFVRRSEMNADQQAELELPGVLLLDTLGELAGAFRLGDVVFVGGSIAPRGGHNILEPAAAGVAIVCGAHMENFEAISRDFVESGALLTVQTADELAPTVEKLLSDPALAKRLGGKARRVVEHKRGAAARIAGRLWPLYWSATTRTPYGLTARIILTSLAKLWVLGGRLKQKRDEARQQHLPCPVISIGGITVGGAGKTPFTNYLAQELARRGYKPAILMRGYRRRTPARNIILPAGAHVPPTLTGDEAQIYLRGGVVAVGIGADRAETGRLLLQHQEADLFLLDDAFQHRKIYRDVDVVIIDGLIPFGHRDTVPLGRLREPLSALARADALIITRADNDFRFEVVTKQLRQYNAEAPIFRVFTRPRQWRMCGQQTILKNLPYKRVAAFCALGNPQGFWNTLDQMGLEVVYRWSFPDHHVYQPTQLRRITSQALSAGAQALVTTEKDRINFPREFVSAVSPLEVAWLEIENVLEQEPAFFEWIETKLAGRSTPEVGTDANASQAQ
jgi:tetraacyldisaccharide 4'-kinase